MTLDEAIKHCEENAVELREQPFKEKMNIEEVAYCEECAEEHEQLAEWLRELKAYKEAPQGDLISRTELKKCAIPCEIHNGALTDLCVPLYQINNAPTVEITETEIQKVLNKRCMTVVTNEYLIALHTTYLEAYKKGLDDGKEILKKEIKERLEEKKRRGSGNEEDQRQ